MSLINFIYLNIDSKYKVKTSLIIWSKIHHSKEMVLYT